MADEIVAQHVDGCDDSDEGQQLAPNERISWLPMDFSVEGLYFKRKHGELDPSPVWQRNYVYDKVKASRLIESVLLDVPLPAVYLAEEKDGALSVIDGQQRLTSFFLFMDDQFPDKSKDAGNQKTFTDFKLSGLKMLKNLNGSKFSGLEKAMQLKIKNTPIHVIIIKNKSDEDIKFDIFERLNTGAMKLNEDEIRNSVYRGPYIEFLDELSNDAHFNQMVDKPTLKNRMFYRGMILRFFALSEKDVKLYKPSMTKYCNAELREHRYLSEEKAAEYRKRFRKCVDLCFSIFGENAFRRFKPGDAADHNGAWGKSRINMALFDVQMCCFAAYEASQFQGHYDEVRERLLDMMCNDNEFIGAIELQTSNSDQMKLRFKKWFDALDSILDGSQLNPRVFPYAIKKQLFDKDPACGICRNQILLIEDAEVDHIVPYSKDGPTTFENAQLAHRFCNRHKSDKTA
jgi:hypothetical protein